MNKMVDVDVILDERYADPKVTIQTRERTAQVENIISAIENAAENEFPLLPGYDNEKIELISQRDIIRVYTENRRIIIQTADKSYYSNKTLSAVEDMLNPERFFRISQSELINLYKVKSFEFTIAGTIGVEFENNTKTWVARSRVKAIKTMIKGKQ
ncbi:MAG: LytTR family transcriptional regulator DNA-binding domain-containing protein [Lachnospiraceae bacterium]|nr:LytTR family transcriptional regulator DNA-binding domain-containing protein [Lachnospiraceae bacterium]